MQARVTRTACAMNEPHAVNGSHGYPAAAVTVTVIACCVDTAVEGRRVEAEPQRARARGRDRQTGLGAGELGGRAGRRGGGERVIGVG